MVEQIGSGIGRMKDSLKENGLTDPEFKLEGMFSVILHRKNIETFPEKTGEKTREKIIRLIREKNDITISEIAANTGLSDKGVEYHINRLKQDKIIEKFGSGKGGHWQIKVNY
jgi:ATP-dependent DNA helicase RecG